MPKSSYIQFNDDAFAAQLQAFKTAVPGYATTLGLTPAQVTAQAADADYFSYVLACQQLIRNSASQWTGWKDLTRAGGDLPPSGAPVAPVFPTAVPPVAPGVEVRFRALVKQIKGSPAYNEAIGAALGIEGSQQTGPDYATLAPNINATISGTHVNVAWDWSGFSAFLDICEIQVDRTGSGFGPLAFDTTPGYVDTEPFPSTPTKWTYRAIYRVGDQRVGQWSKSVSITVGG
ncbi:MAG: hypothetical protein DME97_14525 [Verrucomicrobia bacterium]|nr:MAG: hypothetical protein DME97_14525 [Verrucomicrobiota bacterium]